MSAPRPRIACIIPFRNERRFLAQTLATLEAQTIDPTRLFIIGVDSASTDESAAIFTAWLAASRFHGELIRSERPGIARAINAGLARTLESDCVVRLDSHTIYANDYLQRIDDAFASLPDDVWCVGGAPTPYLDPHATYDDLLCRACYSNVMGLGPADFRSTIVEPREVSTVYLGAWRPGVFARVGAFDERFEANEDVDHSERILEAGGKIYRIPLECGRISTRGAAGLVTQWFKYAFWRMQTLKRHPGAIRLRHVAPPIVLLGGLALLISPLRLALVPFYLLYAGAIVAKRDRSERFDVTLGTLVFFPALHAGFALGLMRGLLFTPPDLKEQRPRTAYDDARVGSGVAEAASTVNPIATS